MHRTPQKAVVTGPSPSVSRSRTAMWARRSIMQSTKSVYRAETWIEAQMNRNSNGSSYGCKEDALSKFLVAASPIPGHVGPMLNVVRMLVGAGHDVVVNTGEGFGRQAVATGARFVP